MLYMHGWFYAPIFFLMQGESFKFLKWLRAVNSGSLLQTMRGVTLRIKQHGESRLSILNDIPEFLHIIPIFFTSR